MTRDLVAEAKALVPVVEVRDHTEVVQTGKVDGALIIKGGWYESRSS
jgi:hypothetical protein